MSDHGGKRKGAGRKPSPDVAKVPYGTKLEGVVVEYLRQCDNAAKTLEDTIKRSKGFREWKGVIAGTSRPSVTYLA